MRWFPTGFWSQGAFRLRSSLTANVQVGRGEPVGQLRGPGQAAALGRLPRGALHRADGREDTQPDAGREKDLGSGSHMALAKMRTADSFYPGKV